MIHRRIGQDRFEPPLLGNRAAYDLPSRNRIGAGSSQDAIVPVGRRSRISFASNHVDPPARDRLTVWAARFPNQPDSVTEARQFAAHHLSGSVTAQALEDVVLAISELATNAIKHAHSSFVLSLDLTEEMLRVEVTDADSRPVVVPSAVALADTGRGLRIVQALADQWGIDASSPGSKRVWFTVRLDEAHTTSERDAH